MLEGRYSDIMEAVEHQRIRRGRAGRFAGRALEEPSMSIQVCSQLEPAMEAILLLERTVAQECGVTDVIGAAAQAISEKNHVPLPELEALTAPLRAFEEDLCSVLLPREDLWGDLFYPGSDHENRLAWSLYFLEHSGALDQPGPFPLHHLLMEALEDTSLPAETAADLGRFLSYLETRPCSDRTKWTMAQAWRQPERFYRQYRETVSLAAPVIQRHQAALQPLAEAAARWVAKSVEADPESLWTELGISVSVPGALVIQPTAVNMKGVGFIWDSAASPEDAAYLVVGILRQPIQDLIHRCAYSNSSEFMADRLKSLSDQRRLDILRALKVKPRYGQELAELLGLTPATISHHMNCLVSDGFVTVDRQGVRGNYSLNQKNLDSFLQSLRQMLL